MMADRKDYPPVALGRLDDESRWHWLGDSDTAFKPYGVLDWTLTACVCVMAIPVLLTFGVFTLGLRAVLKVGA